MPSRQNMDGQIWDKSKTIGEMLVLYIVLLKSFMVHLLEDH